MIAYFARRLVGGAITLFLTGLVIYSLVVDKLWGILYVPPTDICFTDDPSKSSMCMEQLAQRTQNLELDKPWPNNYVAWMFDPDETTQTFFTWYDVGYEKREVAKGINLGIGDFTLRGSGVLTADLGYSTIMERERAVLDMFGKGLGELMLLLMLILPASMAAVLVQRRRRPPAYGLPNYPKSRTLLDLCLRPIRIPGV